ncbi:tyrosine-protein phosphatase non-receptor type substrate 1-like [Heptranchias perlo]|uniref:tyrosine-protein phosphatase non-receptor type substrate 1-like n=1 Tax=Heptranchias perlo TaxID=212740 RepID=UPI003559B10A
MPFTMSLPIAHSEYLPSSCCPDSDETKRLLMTLTDARGTLLSSIFLVPPTPLKITSQEHEKDSSASLTIVCATSPFYPENITFTWYKDGTKTTTEISNVIQLNTDGLYEASSRLDDTPPVPTGTVYTCLVSHVTLQIPATATHIVTYPIGGQITRYLLISACAGVGLVFAVLVLIIGKRCLSKKNKGAQNDDESSDHCKQPATVDVMAPYAALDMTKSRKDPRPKHQERTVYAQTKQRAPENQLTYASIDMTSSKKTAKPPRKDKSTEYAQLRMKNQRADVIYEERKAK